MTYATQSLSELKVLARKANIKPEGDRRNKQNWIDALSACDRLDKIAESDEWESQSEAEFERDLTEWQELTECGDETPDAEMDAVAQISNKKGAIAIVALLLIAIGIIARSILIGGCAAIRYTILLGSMFGEYNPDLDLWYRLQSKRFALAA